ncbi:hypothetical protein MNEG_14623 [Monoraphidium neglectum]|uniref:Uncharacterized protein n=1 Tax=Monoraphidium neglectum TaxID=145388 RepID=A0A0D2MDQ2_9CHLO|nr:hypothetical protein MNEG_14623 [Monoraphidium neglectum]KIY93340.1 hypothetical protein MNEG_14623 [Monoraphidium neglectum]|eukprot:XP_013892360.1 hypothetical protein MNEG_14623 [Monoraphidium neglectum]
MGGAGSAVSAGGMSGCCSQVEDLDEEGPYSDDDDDDEDDDDPRYSLRRIPAPRDPDHYKCMVYARAIINAKLWAAQA